MLLRKINAVVSLLITVFLLVHAIYLAVWMLSQGRIDENAIDVVPWVLTGLTLIHAFISIDVVVSGLMSEENTRKGRMYPKMNIATLIPTPSSARWLTLPCRMPWATGNTRLPHWVAFPTKRRPCW